MALNTVSLRASLNSFLQAFAHRAEIETESLNFHNDMIRKVIGQVEDFATTERDTLASKTLSDEGKATAVATLATNAASKFGFLERVVSRIEGERDTATASLDTIKVPPKAGSDSLQQYLYGKEIRDRYQGLSQQEKDRAFLKAAEAGVDPADQANRDAILWAFQETPGGPMVTEDIMRRALDERGRRLHPELYAAWHQSDLLYDSLNTVRETLTGWLRGLGGNPKTIADSLGGPVPREPSIDAARRMVAA